MKLGCWNPSCNSCRRQDRSRPHHGRANYRQGAESRDLTCRGRSPSRDDGGCVSRERGNANENGSAGNSQTNGSAAWRRASAVPPVKSLHAREELPPVDW